MRLKSVLPAIFVALAAGIAPVSFAQEKPSAEAPAQAPIQVDPQVKKLAKGLIEEGLKVSRAEDMFRDVRRTLREVYIPAVRDAIQGNLPGVLAPDTETAEAMAKVLTVMDYARKAGDELDAALTKNREAMIADAAEQIAKTAKPVEIKDLQAIFELPAVKKGFDAFYAMTKLVTGFSYRDTKTFSGFSGWANGLGLDMHGMPGLGSGGVPSKRKIAKAQELVDDIVSVSHLDEMVSNVRRFARDVYAETVPMTDEDREELRAQADQYAFIYNMQKAILLAAAPATIAAALSDDQLVSLHGYVRSPAFAKAFELLSTAVRSATAFTKEDIFQAQKSFEDLEKKSKASERSQADQDKARAEWDALVDNWMDRLKNSISPETRDGLQKALDDLDTNSQPI